MYCKIKSITKLAKREAVYDLVNVSENHNFVTPAGIFSNCDEAVRFAAASEFNKTESRELKKLVAVIRPKHYWIFFNIPAFGWIDSKYRESMSSFWLRMIDRGTGIMFEKDKGECKEAYHVDELQELMGTVKFFTPVDKIKRKVMKHPCYFDTFTFPELPENVYREYELVRNAINLRREIEKAEISNKDIGKIVCYNLLNNWDRIASFIQRSKDSRITYQILSQEILVDPVTQKSLASDQTLRLWVQSIERFIASKGKGD